MLVCGMCVCRYVGRCVYAVYAVHIYIYIYVCVCVYIYIYTVYIHKYIHIYIYICIHVFLCMRACVTRCKCICVYYMGKCVYVSRVPCEVASPGTMLQAQSSLWRRSNPQA